MGDIRAPDIKDLAEKDYIKGMKYKDIAAKYDVTLNTVKSWKQRYKWNRKGVHTKDKKVCTQNNKKNTLNKEPMLEAVTELENSELTEKQKLFCIYYIKNFNATQAAIKAGYSHDSAGVIGYENLTKPYIRAEINRLKEIKKQSIMLTEDDIVEKYMRIAFADMSDFVTFGQEDVPVMSMFGPLKDEDGNEITKRINTVRFKESYEVDGGLIREIGQGKDGAKLKIEDRQKALDWLANFFEMNPMNKHKKNFDNAKLEIERAKLNKDSNLDKPIEIVIKRKGEDK